MTSAPLPASFGSDIATQRIVHIVPPNGGGVDRMVRDLCSHRPGDWLLHITEDQWVIECSSEGVLIPVAVAEVGSLLARGVLGRAAGLHAHSTLAPVRNATGLLAAYMRLPYVVTLHDVEFAGSHGSADNTDSAQRRDFILAAARCTVPSEFLRSHASKVMGAGFDCELAPNGVDPRLLAEVPVTQTTGSERFPVAVIGAMGRHKGLAHLLEVAAHLPAHVRIGLLGYADGQLGGGLLADGKIHVHGPFEPAELPGLVRHYGASIAFFPKGQPESYCYALSDAWLAGLSAVGPDLGAIGERVRVNDGGCLYDPDAPPAEVAAMIVRECEAAHSGRIDVSRAVESLVSTGAMVETMNKIYAGIATAATPVDFDALKQAASAHLDSRFFRKELLRLQGDLAATAQQRDNALQELRSLSENFEKRGSWIEQLQRDQDALRSSCEHLEGDRAELKEGVQVIEHELERLRGELARRDADFLALQQAHEALKETNEALERRLAWPFSLLPSGIQAQLTKLRRQGPVARKSNG